MGRRYGLVLFRHVQIVSALLQDHGIDASPLMLTVVEEATFIGGMYPWTKVLTVDALGLPVALLVPVPEGCKTDEVRALSTSAPNS